MDTSKFTYFVLLPERMGIASYGFSGYQDKAGENRQILDGRRDHNGTPLPRKFRFSRKERAMRIPNSQKDLEGNNVVKFLKEHPECVGSPNGAYVESKGKTLQSGTWFKVLDNEKDAKLAVKAKVDRLAAENSALNLKGKDLADMSALCGEFSTNETMQRHKVLEWAGTDPESFTKSVNEPDVKMRSLVRRAVNHKLFEKQGQIIKWDEVLIGHDEQSAVEALLSDKDLRESVEKNLKTK